MVCMAGPSIDCIAAEMTQSACPSVCMPKRCLLPLHLVLDVLALTSAVTVMPPPAKWSWLAVPVMRRLERRGCEPSAVVW